MSTITVKGIPFNVRFANRTAFFEGGQFINEGQITVFEDGKSHQVTYSAPSGNRKSQDFYEIADELFEKIKQEMNQW